MPSRPRARYRFHHKYPVGRDTPNSSQSWVKGFSPRVAATTNSTRFCRTSIVFQPISLYTPSLASLATECKGCPETFCKACHGTEHLQLVCVGELSLPSQFHSASTRTSSDNMKGMLQQLVWIVERGYLSGGDAKEY